MVDQNQQNIENNPLLKASKAATKAKESRRQRLEAFRKRGVANITQVAAGLTKRAAETKKGTAVRGVTAGAPIANARQALQTDGVDRVNFRQSNAAALRGAESAMDLKRVFLPPTAQAPDAGVIRGAIEQMGLVDGAHGDVLATDVDVEAAFQASLQRNFPTYVAVAQQDTALLSNSADAVQELMVDRSGRITGFSDRHVAANPSLKAAAESDGTQYEGDALVAGAAVLQARVRESASPMHQQLAKVAGFKFEG